MKGYFELPDVTKEVLQNGWFHTGDIGEVNSDGEIRLIGRKTFVINRAGLKIYPEDIDFLLEKHPRIKEACTFGIPDQIAGEIVGVAIVPLNEEPLDPEEVRAWCHEFITPEKIPERFFMRTSIPKTDRGKIQRNIVAENCLQNETGN